MKKKISFFIGSYFPSSTQTLFSNLLDLIGDNFTIEFFGFYDEEKLDDDISEVIYEYPSEKGFKGMISTSKTLKRYDKDHNPDLIVLPHKYGEYGPAFLLSADLNKTIIRLNDDTFNFYKDEVYETKINRAKSFLINNILSKIVLKKSLGVIVQTEYMKKECEKRNIDTEKTEVLPLPIDTTIFKKVDKKKKDKIRRELDIDKNSIIALIVGSHSRRKRHQLLDELLKRSKELDDITFMIIGKTDYGRKLSEKYPNVRYEGFVEHDNLHRYYQAGDFLLHFATLEGLPTVFQEASACGLPIIAREANYNQGMDICKYETVVELEKLLIDEVWKDLKTHVTHGLSKKEYLDFFKGMIEKKERSQP